MLKMPKTSQATFHENHHNIKELLKGQVTVSILISEREHGVHEQGVRFEPQCVSKL